MAPAERREEEAAAPCVAVADSEWETLQLVRGTLQMNLHRDRCAIAVAHGRDVNGCHHHVLGQSTAVDSAPGQ